MLPNLKTAPGRRLRPPALSLLSTKKFFNVFALSLLVIASGCKKKEIIGFLLTNGYEQTNLVSDTSLFKPAFIDHNLINAWGIAPAPSGPIWISANNAGVSTIYSHTGATLIPPVTIPTPTSSTGGAPTGVIFNNTSAFSFMKGKTRVASRFIFSTEDGTLAAWGGGSSATIVANRSATSVYKGLALAMNGSTPFLYATDFHSAKIDVFDSNYHLVSGMLFSDPTIPSGFAPFNIRSIGSWLYVTYAKQNAEKHDDVPGLGNGYINIFKTNGTLVKRFASAGVLNSPWGLTQNNTSFCDEAVNGILVGNFGDGRIHLYDEWGNLIGALRDDGKPISIEGLWGIENNIPNAPANELFFTAGPLHEKHGLFGYLKRR